MNIASILARKGARAVTVRLEQSVREGLALLARHNIGALIVVEGDRPVGILSELDIVREAARREDVFTWTVNELMTRDVIAGQPEDDLRSVAHTMTEKRVRHPPVVEHGRLVGVISIGDVVKAQRDQNRADAEALQAQLLADQPGRSQ